jgi:hypothetical protein
MGIGNANRRASILSLVCLVMGGSSIYCSSVSAQIPDPGNLYYPGNANSVSYLVGYGATAANRANTEISSAQFANWVGNAFDPGGLPNINDADFYFQQCFGGGMFSPLINAMGRIPWAGGSASSWNQVALASPSPAPGFVQPQYATWSANLLPQMNSNPNQSVKQDAKIAQQTDFFGPNSIYYREDPNYLSYNGGNANTIADAGINGVGGVHNAVIFVGDTGIYGTAGDFTKLGQSMRNVSADLIKTLSSDWAGTNFNIYLLFGDGTNATLGFNTASSVGANVGLNMVNTINANNAIYHTTILPGTPASLQNTITQLGNLPNSFNNQFLFFGFDHGDRQIVPQRLILAGPNQPAGSISITNSSNTDPPVISGATYDTTFSLGDPNITDPQDNPNGELIDATNEEDPADPPNLIINYSGLDTNLTGEVDVLLNGIQIGTLDPSLTSVTLDVSPADIQDGDTLEIANNSNELVNINSEYFDAGALPIEDASAFVPEPAAGAIALFGLGYLARRRRSAKA